MNNMPKYIKNTLIVIALLVLTVIGYKSVQSLPDIKTTEAAVEEKVSSAGTISSDKLIDINSATVEELDSLPNIGPKRAETIVEMREEMGGFYSVNDLLCVDGIGEKILEELKKLVKVNK